MRMAHSGRRPSTLVWSGGPRRPLGTPLDTTPPRSPHSARTEERPSMIIDSQIHAYEANTPKRPWHTVPNWPAHVTGDEMVAAMDAVGVDGAIFISAFS